MAKVLLVGRGLEDDRLLRAIAYHSPEKVIVVGQTPEKERDKAIADEVQAKLEYVEEEVLRGAHANIAYASVKEFDAKNHTTDCYHFGTALTDLTNLVRKLRKNGDEIFIDLSTGPKLLSIVLCFVAHLNNIKVSYFPKIRKNETKLDIIRIPQIPIDPGEIPLDILQVLHETGQPLSNAEILDTMQLPKSNKKYGALGKRLAILREMKLIKTEKRGKKRVHFITERGKIATELPPSLFCQNPLSADKEDDEDSDEEQQEEETSEEPDTP